MSDPRWIRVRELAERALDLSPEERARFLATECGDDADLRSEVEALLDVEADEDFLEPPELAEEVGKGFVLGEFRILRELGRGGMGVVYLARQESLARDVALKVFHENLTTTEREVERFHREARAAGRLSHPGVVRVLAEGREGRAHWFAMEYVPGHDLARELELLRDGSPATAPTHLPPRDGSGYHAAVARLVADVADALQHAHENGLVHRDVKPQNILLRAGGEVLLTDFGIVRDEHLGTLTGTGELTGTPNYMSPEQARAASDVIDHRTDVYSLGVVLYELLTGRRAHDGPTQADVLMHIRDVEPKPVRSLAPTVPVDLATICEQAMRPEVDARYATAKAFAEDLRRFLAHEPIVARRRGLGEKAVAWGRKHGPLLAAGVLLAAGLGGVSAYAYAQVRSRTMTLVQVRVTGEFDQRPRIGRQVVDVKTGLVGEVDWVTTGTSHEEYVDPGGYRFVAGSGDRFAAATRYVGLGEVLELELKLVPPDLDDMVRVPSGTITLEVGLEKITPLHGTPVDVSGFWMDRTEVSNADWRRYAAETGADVPSYFDRIDGEDWDDPVAGIPWPEAQRYAEHHGKRLATFWEWELAARGSELRFLPWGNDLPLRGNASGEVKKSHGVQDYLENVVPVDSMPEAATPEGILHLYGNVAEWSESPATITIREYGGDARMVMGGMWSVGTAQSNEPNGPSLFSAFGFRHTGMEPDPVVGIRCVRDLTP